jgi:hypothetical protein
MLGLRTKLKRRVNYMIVLPHLFQQQKTNPYLNNCTFPATFQKNLLTKSKYFNEKSIKKSHFAVKMRAFYKALYHFFKGLHGM